MQPLLVREVIFQCPPPENTYISAQATQGIQRNGKLVNIIYITYKTPPHVHFNDKLKPWHWSITIEIMESNGNKIKKPSENHWCQWSDPK